MLDRLRRRSVVALAFLVGGGGFAYDADGASPADAQIAVIASNQVSSTAIDDGTLREIYLKRVFLDSAGRHYVPVNLPPSHRLRSAFLFAVLHMNASHLQAYWDRQYFQGISPPYVLGSQAAVVRFVAKTPGAIGYVQRCFVTPDVRVILWLTVSEPEDELADKCPDAQR